MIDSADRVTQYHEALDKVVERISKTDDLRARVYSIALFGSLSRGDFVYGESDIDLMIVLEWPRIVEKEGWKGFDEYGMPVREVFLECFKHLPVPESRGHLLDLPTVPRAHLPLRGVDVPLDPDFDYPVFKYLGVYRFDLEHWKILYGEDFRSGLVEADYRGLLPTMAANLLSRNRSVGSLKEVLGIALHAIRLSQVFYGEETLDKRKVMGNFQDLVPVFPLKHLAWELWELGKRMNLVTAESMPLEHVREFVNQLVGPITNPS